MPDQLDEMMKIVRLEYHLTGNFYPPKSAALAPLCLTAINQCNEGKGDELIPGVTLNDERVTANQVIDWYHLEYFVEEEICL